jgi:hypothetical protein
VNVSYWSHAHQIPCSPAHVCSHLVTAPPGTVRSNSLFSTHPSPLTRMVCFHTTADVLCMRGPAASCLLTNLACPGFLCPDSVTFIAKPCKLGSSLLRFSNSGAADMLCIRRPATPCLLTELAHQGCLCPDPLMFLTKPWKLYSSCQLWFCSLLMSLMSATFML